MIQNQQLVISYFGYWPEFADGKIDKFSYDRTGSIEMTVHYIDCEKQKSARIGFRFDSVSEVVLNELLSENVIDSLQFSDGEQYRISIEACYGLNGSFNCKNVTVVYVNA